MDKYEYAIKYKYEYAVKYKYEYVIKYKYEYAITYNQNMWFSPKLQDNNVSCT